MNILYCAVDLFGLGGVQRYSRYEASILERMVPPVRLTAVSLFAPQQHDYFDQPLPKELTSAHGSRRRFMLDLLAQARCSPPDLVIADYLPMGPFALAMAARWRVPYIINVYGLEVWRPLPAKFRVPLLRATAIMSDCVFTQRYLQAQYRHLPPIAVIQDPVDCDRYQPREYDPAYRRQLGLKHGPVLLTVSRLKAGRSKGHDVVLRAMAQLVDTFPSLQYVIVGDGDDRPRLEALAVSLGLRERVVFTGRLDDGELPAVYHACDLFVLVSRFREGKQAAGEGVPLAVLEAQASGRAAITSKLDGSAESIVDGETGLLVDPHSVDEVAGAIARLLGDPALLRSMSARAAGAARQRNGLPVFAMKLTRLIELVTSKEVRVS
ncbi:MAG: glycosyltransferase family 4 protein [Chloroflexi bacterium]|nr:glycosyltransferase family 4 protein [Chloroflexota bacterium]